MNFKKIIAVVIFSFISVNLQAQEIELSGSLKLDSQIAFENTKELASQNNSLSVTDKRSPLLAAGLSFAIPGAGQFYNDDFWKTAIFVAVEAAAIFTAVSYDNKGDDQTESFEKFANENWSPVQYATWTYQKYVVNGSIEQSKYPQDEFFAQVNNRNWALLNRLENEIGGYYSHRLAPYDDQQYYEMIGKYAQFNPGWNDFGDENTPFEYGDPKTDKFLYYAGERGKANDFYTVSKTAVIIVVTNHILSALEAAWSAHRYNRSLEVNVSLEKEQIGYRTELIPQLNMKYRISL
ncbi:MAG: hypothetical protein HND52_05295 [Ignavibacteriae bacterium]|nr:hypothetical protein [Ignavibacteriota bacterium]NOG97367.1 hypothetical protein [Ignavibacteriota bacterium]